MVLERFFYDDLSWKPQINKSERPIYSAIVKALEEDIKNNVLKAGDKLPPQRELADYLDINLTTVTKAYKACEKKGLIFATTGKGTFVSSDAGVSTASAVERHAEPGLIDMGTLHPSYDQDNLVAESMHKAADKMKYGAYRKESYNQIGADWLKRFHINAKPENIVIASGAQNALAVSLVSLFQPGDKIGTDCLTYMGFKNLASFLGIRLVPIEADKDGMDTDFLQRACRTENLKGLYIMPECQNPTTYTMSLSKREKIADIVKENNLILIEDDEYSFLGNTEFPPVSEFIPEQSIYINGTAKSLSAGLRISFMSVAPKYRHRIDDGIYCINMNISDINAVILANLIETGRADEILKQKQQTAEERNIIVNQIFSDYTVHGNRRDYFRWLILPEGWTGKEFELCAKVSGVQIFCAERFSVGSNPAHPAVRIALSSVKNKNELIKGLNIIKDLLKKNPDISAYII